MSEIEHLANIDNDQTSIHIGYDHDENQIGIFMDRRFMIYLDIDEFKKFVRVINMAEKILRDRT